MQLLPRSNPAVDSRYVLCQFSIIIIIAPHDSLQSVSHSVDQIKTTRRVPAQHKTAVTYCVFECWSISLTRWWLGNLCGVWVLNLPLCVRAGGVSDWGGTGRACRINGCTHLAVFLVLAPHLFAEAPGCLAGSVRGDDVVVDQSWQVSPHRGQVSTVRQPWRAHVHNSRSGWDYV